jgi:type IV secretion system protein VirB11
MILNKSNSIINRAESINQFLAPIQHLLNDEKITEIAINRPNEVFIESALGWEKLDIDMSLNLLMSLSTAVAKYSENDISSTNPILSATLPNNERIQIVMPPACEAETIAITIRKPSKKLYTLKDYRDSGFFEKVRSNITLPDSAEIDLLKLKEKGDYESFFQQSILQSKNIVVAGETGSGKTTFMKALVGSIPIDQRIITIEDVPELFMPNHQNHVHLYYQSEAKEEEAVVTPAALLKSCLRMKPDRILLAELRSAETYDFINVCASGHDGSITSCHAGSVEQTFERLALMILQNRQGRSLSYEVIRQLLYSVIDVVVHIKNDINGRYINELWYEPQVNKQRTK